MKFVIEHKDRQSSARAGEILTDHGKISTPVFMPVGTAGAVKAVHIRDLRHDIGAQIILGNTYHLFLRPGMEVMGEAGGLHAFNGWEKPILTDSGGFQVYSLSQGRKVTGKGVEFRSHIDGTKYLFTPENVIETQRIIGADIIMAFDECTPFPCSYDYASRSLELTHQWLDRCIATFAETHAQYGNSQALFPIVQGSVYSDLRQKSAETVASCNLPGNAIGGLSVGEPEEIMYDITEKVCAILPEDKPRYLMGVGTPSNILECIALGVDMFDCVIPTRNARHGLLYTMEGMINIKNEKWKNDFSMIDEEGRSFAGREYSKAYLRHLFVSNESLGGMIASLYNLGFYMWLMDTARKKIVTGGYPEWKNRMVKQLAVKL
ncbi:MAG: tRNA guanosine(34) transglycosylase Tgt [Bacteroidales bacterium]|nr:tRNA guanosine(34) transglycosylase Tgt [Bacteroidales bacterium]